MNTPHVIIIGAGFGGLNVAKQLLSTEMVSRCRFCPQLPYSRERPLLEVSSESSRVRNPNRFITKTRACLPQSGATGQLHISGVCRSAVSSPG